MYSILIGCVFLLNSSFVAAHRVRVRFSFLGVISARFLLNLRMIKSEDQEYKSRHFTADPACASDAVVYSLSFGVLTGFEGLVDQFELDDMHNEEGTSTAMKRSTWGTSSRAWRTPLPAGQQL